MCTHTYTRTQIERWERDLHDRHIHSQERKNAIVGLSFMLLVFGHWPDISYLNGTIASETSMAEAK